MARKFAFLTTRVIGNGDWRIHQFMTRITSELPRVIRPYAEIHVVSLSNVLVILNLSIFFSGVYILVAKKIVILLYNWKIVSFAPWSL